MLAQMNANAANYFKKIFSIIRGIRVIAGRYKFVANFRVKSSLIC